MATKTITVGGTVTTSNEQAKFGSTSGKFGTSASNELTVGASSDFDFGSDDFTVEGFVYVTNGATNGHIVNNNGAYTRGWSLATYGGGSLGCYAIYGASPSWTYSAWAVNSLSLNAWHHMALVRTSGTIYLFCDGTRYATGADYTFPDDNYNLSIGGNGGVYGYLDEIRLSKGIARYTGATYTVPTAAFDTDAYTVLLMHFEGENGGTTFVDSSMPPGNPGAFFQLF